MKTATRAFCRMFISLKWITAAAPPARSRSALHIPPASALKTLSHQCWARRVSMVCAFSLSLTHYSCHFKRTETASPNKIASILELNDKERLWSSIGPTIKPDLCSIDKFTYLNGIAQFYCNVCVSIHCQSCISEGIILLFLPNAEPVHSGQEGADEPPTLIKEDLLSSGTVRRSTTDAQVHFLKMGSWKTKTFEFNCHLISLLHV